MKHLAIALLLALPTANVLATDTTTSLSVSDNTSQSLVGVPATPSTYPGNGGNSYQPVGYNYTIPFDSVLGATYYELYESNTDSNYNLAYSGNLLYSNFLHYDYGYKYYKYKACNSAGCSGLSPWRRMYIYDTPGAPKNLRVSPLNVPAVTDYTVSWTPAGGAVTGTVYTVYESFNWGEEKPVHTVTRQHWSETSYSFTTNNNIEGTYNYRIQACSPAIECGGSADVQQLVTTTNNPPRATGPTIGFYQYGWVEIDASQIGTDAEGSPLKIIISSNPSHGSINLYAGEETFSYRPHGGYLGDDYVWYQVVDEAGLKSNLTRLKFTIVARP